MELEGYDQVSKSLKASQSSLSNHRSVKGFQRRSNKLLSQVNYSRFRSRISKDLSGSAIKLGKLADLAGQFRSH